MRVSLPQSGRTLKSAIRSCRLVCGVRERFERDSEPQLEARHSCPPRDDVVLGPPPGPWAPGNRPSRPEPATTRCSDRRFSAWDAAFPSSLSPRPLDAAAPPRCQSRPACSCSSARGIAPDINCFDDVSRRPGSAGAWDRSKPRCQDRPPRRPQSTSHGANWRLHLGVWVGEGSSIFSCGRRPDSASWRWIWRRSWRVKRAEVDWHSTVPCPKAPSRNDVERGSPVRGPTSNRASCSSLPSHLACQQKRRHHISYGAGRPRQLLVEGQGTPVPRRQRTRASHLARR